MLTTDYFTKVLEDNLKAVIKPQYVDQIPKTIKGTDRTVQQLLELKNTMGNLKEVCDVLGNYPARTDGHSMNMNDMLTTHLELNHILDRDVSLLSGGELQRFAIGYICVQKADVYVPLHSPVAVWSLC